jgi:hypothetical protein
MMHLEVIDREDGHQIWRTVVIIVNKHSLTVIISWSLSLGDKTGGKQLLTIESNML